MNVEGSLAQPDFSLHFIFYHLEPESQDFFVSSLVEQSIWYAWKGVTNLKFIDLHKTILEPNNSFMSYDGVQN